MSIKLSQFKVFILSQVDGLKDDFGISYLKINQISSNLRPILLDDTVVTMSSVYSLAIGLA